MPASLGGAPVANVDESMLPRIVAIETSGRAGSVAVARGGRLLAERELAATSRHAIELMPAIKDLTEAQGWRPSDIDHCYLSLGPGSFTGLRIAVAIARALAQTVGTKLVGVPSLDVIAQNAPKTFGIVIPLLDAKRGQVFAARYERDDTGTLHAAAPATLMDPRELVETARKRAALFTHPADIAVLGEGVDYHRPALFTPGIHQQASSGSVIQPSIVQPVELDRSLWPGKAATVHRLGWMQAQQNAFSDPATLLPIYVRLPEAEEVYRKKHGLPPG